MKTNILKIIAIIFSAVLISCQSNHVSNHQHEEHEHEEHGTHETLPEDIVELRDDQQKIAEIDTGRIEMLLMSTTIKASGTVGVTPQNLASISLPLSGFVKSVNLLPGNPVKKGQLLAIIESQEFIDLQQNYLEAKSRYDFAEAEYKRHSELFREEVYSQKNIQQITSDYKSLKAQVKALEQKLRLIGVDPLRLNEDNIKSSFEVLSPMNGFVKSVYVNIGKSVSPTDVLFEIINSDHLMLELVIFEKDVEKINTGNRVIFSTNSEAEQHNATVIQTDKSIGADKTFKIYAMVNDRCKNILPGMYVNAVIESSKMKTTAVPSEAIVSFNDKYYIFVVEKNKTENGRLFTEYRMVEVQKGVSDGRYTQIILPEGFDYKSAKVVTKGAYSLLSAKKNAGEMAC
ncbi:MAG: efflux RND transporter periplasmic adaptor subunit [Bacteroidales bacterium]|nr:efflux RND transporter periplasmic adaptor subunit [Bacteroidales bacterium]